MSLDQAALAVECEPGDDAEFAELATVLTLPQLRNALRAANPPQPKPAAANESVTMGPDRHGQWECKLRLDVDRGAVFEAALAAMRDELFHDGNGDVTWADAAVELANRGLDSTNPARRERFRINLFIDFDTDGQPTTTWSDGAHVPDTIRDLLGCDATITPITRIGGHPVNVGRAQRIVPDRTRRIVEHRDQKCRVPWCPHKRWLQIHHIIHWTSDGPTETWNLVALCPACHRQHHHGELAITGNADHPDGLTFTDRNGNTIDPATRPTKPTGPPPRPTPPLPPPRRRPHPKRRPLLQPAAPHPTQLGAITPQRASNCLRSSTNLGAGSPSLHGSALTTRS